MRKPPPTPKRLVTSPNLPAPSGHFAQATLIDSPACLLFISGMLAKDASGTLVGFGDITAQTRQVCENLKAPVEAAGGTLANICRADVYIRNMEHLPQIHPVRREYFPGEAPASTMVEVSKFTTPDALIEINAITDTNWPEAKAPALQRTLPAPT